MRSLILSASLLWLLTDNGMAILPRMRTPLARRGVVTRKPRDRQAEKERRIARWMRALGFEA